MAVQASLMNVIMLVKAGTPQLAARLLNVADKPHATLMVAECVDLLEKAEFAELKKYLREEANTEREHELVLLTDEQALELAQYAHRRSGVFGEEQPAPAS